MTLVSLVIVQMNVRICEICNFHHHCHRQRIVEKWWADIPDVKFTLKFPVRLFHVAPNWLHQLINVPRRMKKWWHHGELKTRRKENAEKLQRDDKVGRMRHDVEKQVWKVVCELEIFFSWSDDLSSWRRRETVENSITCIFLLSIVVSLFLMCRRRSSMREFDNRRAFGAFKLLFMASSCVKHFSIHHRCLINFLLTSLTVLIRNSGNYCTISTFHGESEAMLSSVKFCIERSHVK